MSTTTKTVLIVVFCVVALAVAVWSGYRSFVPQGKVTYGGSFGSKDAERREDDAGADSLAGAPSRRPQPGSPSGGRLERGGDSLSGAPQNPMRGGD